MRHLLVCLVIGCFAATAFAGENPDIRIYLDADPNNHIHEIHPTAGSTFEVYVCLDCFGEGGGTRGTAFLLERTFGGYKLSQMALLGGLDFGDAEVDGWTIAAGADCAYPDADGVVWVGVLTYLYLGPEGYLKIHPHPGTGNEALDCNFDSDFYCVHANLGVSMPPPDGDPDCECQPPEPNPDVGLALHVDYAGHECDHHLADCAFINTSVPEGMIGQPLDFMVMVCYFPNGFMGAEYSLVWPAGWTFVNWQSCADWDGDPYDGTSGDGTIQWWNTCQPAPGPAGGPYTIGILTLTPTTPGRVLISTHPGTGFAGVYNCIPTLDPVLPWRTVGNGRAGWVDVGTGPGCNPCFCVGPPCYPPASPVQDATWGAIKAMYRE